MATTKVSGLGAQVTVADSGGTVRDISPDVTDFTVNTPRAIFDWTGIDKYAHERGLGLADVSFSLKGIFDAGAGLAHAVFATVTSTTVERATVVAPTSTHASPQLPFNAYYSDYSVARATGGELTWQAKGDLADGVAPVWA